MKFGETMFNCLQRKMGTLKKIITVFSPLSFFEYLRYSHKTFFKPTKNGLLRLNNGLTFSVRPGTLDAYILLEIFGDRIYLRDLDALKRSKRIMDVGAHIGSFTIQAASLCPEATVFSFEPVEDNFNLLKSNIELNKIQNIRFFKKGISSKTGNQSFYVKLTNDSSRLSLRADEREENFRKITIETLSLQEAIKQNHLNTIDFLKMDVEGAEYDILFSTPPEIIKKIRYLAMEWHVLKNSKFGVKDIVDLLRKNNFYVVYEPSSNSISGMLYAKNLNIADFSE